MDNVWINGQQGQLIQADDRGLNYGDGLFLTMRVSPQGKILFLETHLSRIEQAIYRLNICDENRFWQLPQQQKVLLEKLAQGNPNKGIKLLISRGSGGRGYSAENCQNITTVISVFKLPTHYKDFQHRGIQLYKSEIELAKQPRLAGLKHLNRLEQVLIRSYDLPEGYQDWLVLDSDNKVIEASMANLFFYKDEKWITPALSKSGVAGVMREQVIYTLLDLGFNIEITDIVFDELNHVDHILMTNCLMGAVNITKVNKHYFEPWNSTQALNDALGVLL